LVHGVLHSQTIYLKQWSNSFDCLAAWKAHDGIILSSVVTKDSDGFFCLVTGGNDSNIKVDKIVLISSQLFMLYVGLGADHAQKDANYDGRTNRLEQRIT